MKRNEKIWIMIAGSFGAGFAILGIWELLAIFWILAGIVTLAINFLTGIDVDFFFTALILFLLIVFGFFVGFYRQEKHLRPGTKN